MVTDGLSNRDEHLTQQHAQNFKNAGVEIFVIALDGNVDQDELKKIASEPVEEHLKVQDFINSPSTLIDFTVYSICKLPVPTPGPPSK